MACQVVEDSKGGKCPASVLLNKPPITALSNVEVDQIGSSHKGTGYLQNEMLTYRTHSVRNQGLRN